MEYWACAMHCFHAKCEFGENFAYDLKTFIGMVLIETLSLKKKKDNMPILIETLPLTLTTAYDIIIYLCSCTVYGMHSTNTQTHTHTQTHTFTSF